MISISYVNTGHEDLYLTDPFIKCEKAIDDIVNESNKSINAFLDSFNLEVTEATIEDREINSEIYTEATNVFEKIGNAIIAIFKKFSEFIDRISDKIKNASFKKKSDIEKMEALIKEHPELSDDIIAKFNNGDLVLSDAKSLKEVEGLYDELIRMAKDSKVDSNTFKGKVNAFKKKLKESDQSAIVKGAKSAAAVISAGTAILTLSKLIKDVQKNKDERRMSTQRMYDKALDLYDEVKAGGEKDSIDTSMGKLGVIQQLFGEVTKDSMGKIQKNENALERLGDNIHAFIAKHSSIVQKHDADKAAKLDKQGKDFVKYLEDRSIGRRYAKDDDARNTEYARHLGSAEYNHTNPHEMGDDDYNNEFNKTYARKDAEYAWNKTHPTSANSSPRKTTNKGH